MAPPPADKPSVDTPKPPTPITAPMKLARAKTKKMLDQISEQTVENDIPGDVAPASLGLNQIASTGGISTLDEKTKHIAARKRSVEASPKEDGNPSPLKQTRSDKTCMDSDDAQGEQAEVRICAVRDLNPELKTSWVLVGRILARNPIRSFSTWRGKSRLFEVYVSDEHRAIIRATVFNDGVDKFYEIVVPGSICSFSTGRIKTANSAFALPDSAVEFSFGADADIVQVHDNTVIFPEPVSQHTPLADLPTQDPTATPTVHGVIVNIGPQRSITARKGTETQKREFLLVDDSDAEILCTSWGQTASEIEISLKGHVILVTRAQILDYMGVRSLNVGVGSVVLHDPALSRSTNLKTWFGAVAPGHRFTKLNG